MTNNLPKDVFFTIAGKSGEDNPDSGLLANTFKRAAKASGIHLHVGVICDHKGAFTFWLDQDATIEEFTPVFEEASQEIGKANIILASYKDGKTGEPITHSDDVFKAAKQESILSFDPS